MAVALKALKKSLSIAIYNQWLSSSICDLKPSNMDKDRIVWTEWTYWVIREMLLLVSCLFLKLNSAHSHRTVLQLLFPMHMHCILVEGG